MAISLTGTSLIPIMPASSPGMTSPAMTVIPLNASTEFTAGDILIDDGAGFATPDNAEPSAIIGVAMCGSTFTSPATIDPEGTVIGDQDGDISVINVALALPGQKFSGTFVDVTGDADHTAAATDLLTQYGINEHTGTDFAMVDQGEVTAETVWVESFVNPGFDGLVPTETYYGRHGAIGKENVRVNFYFITDLTVFGT